MLSASVSIDLTGNEQAARHAVGYLDRIPAGARVIVHVGKRPPEPAVVRFLAPQVDRLELDVRGDPDVLDQWLAAIRGAP